MGWWSIAFLIRRAPALTGPTAFMIRTDLNLCRFPAWGRRASRAIAADARRRRQLLAPAARDRDG